MKRERWVDICKCIAIVAVIIDHLYSIVYNNETIWKMTYFSVSLFVLSQGFTTYISFSKTKIPLYKKVLIHVRNIMIPYLAASFICTIILYKSFDFAKYFTAIVNFNALGPYYYVSVYIQLVLISPILFWMINETNKQKYPLIYEGVLVIFIIIISCFTSMHTKLNESYGGGSKLLGGSYLIIFCIGMILGSEYPKIVMMKRKTIILGIILSIVLTLCCLFYITNYGFIILNMEIFGTGINPPGIPLLLYGIVLFCLIMFIGVIIESKNYDNVLIKVLTYIGRHTLYIFLYHEMIFLLIPYLDMLNIMTKRFVYVMLMLGIPLMLEKSFELLYKMIKHSYFYCGDMNT